MKKRTTVKSCSFYVYFKEKYTKICDEILENTGLCVSLLSDFNEGAIKINADKNVMSINAKNQFINVTCGENMIVNDIAVVRTGLVTTRKKKTIANILMKVFIILI